MFWIADVFIGTNSQGWGNHEKGIDPVENTRKHKRVNRLAKATGRAWVWLTSTLYAMREKHVMMRQLNQLNDHMLRDIGVTRADIVARVKNPQARRSPESAPRVSHRSIEVKTCVVVNKAAKPVIEQGAADDGDASCPEGSVRRAA